MLTIISFITCLIASFIIGAIIKYKKRFVKVKSTENFKEIKYKR